MKRDSWLFLKALRANGFVATLTQYVLSLCGELHPRQGCNISAHVRNTIRGVPFNRTKMKVAFYIVFSWLRLGEQI